MIKFYLTSFLSLFLLFQLPAKAQIPNEREIYFDTIKILWADEKNSVEAVDKALSYQIKWPYIFSSKIDKILVPILNSTTKTSGESAFLEKLYAKNDTTINKIITPIYYWNKIHLAKKDSEKKLYLEKMTTYLNNSANYSNRTERFALMAVRDLENKKYSDTASIHLLYAKVKKNLSQFKNLEQSDFKADPNSQWQRHWFRNLTAYCYYQDYLKNPKNSKALEGAVKFSPDFVDKSFIYEIETEKSLLFGESPIPDYHLVYFDYLTKNNQSKSALEHMTEVTLNEPTDQYMEILKKSYLAQGLSETFVDFWKKKVETIMKPFPELSFTFNTNQTIDFSKPSDKWIYLDVWATWCSPCVKELPEIEKLYQSLKNNSELEMFTLSYESKDLNKFLGENKYTFPVTEVTTADIKFLEVKLYPTKFLLNPDKKYLVLPYGKWEEYTRNYGLFEIEK